MNKYQCPECKFRFTHKKGMEWCTCNQSAVDLNSGGEIDTKYARLIGSIAEEENLTRIVEAIELNEKEI